jgi:cytochrome P450
MTFLSQYDAADRPGKVALLQSSLATSPRDLFAELRDERPIFDSPIGTIVTRYRDVVEVLERQDHFSVELYAPKMERLAGPFILGLDDGSLYERDVSILRLAIRRDDIAGIGALVRTLVEQAVDEVASRHRIDAVADLTRIVPARMVAKYFGTPGPDEATLLRWGRALFHDIFLNLADDATVRTRADVESAQMRSYLDALIAMRKQQGAQGQVCDDDLVGRLIRMQGDSSTRLDDESIRNNLIGLIVGAIDTTSAAASQAIDVLLDRPDALIGATAAATSDDDPRLARHVFEALRFRPQANMLLRRCTAPFIVAKGTDHATEIPAGQRVFAAIGSAMFDPEVLDSPEEFRLDRPAHHYLHFGEGLHRCFGRFINQVQVPALVKGLLRLPNLRRAPDPDGRLRFEGPFPVSLVLEFG